MLVQERETSNNLQSVLLHHVILLIHLHHRLFDYAYGNQFHHRMCLAMCRFC